MVQIPKEKGLKPERESAREGERERERKRERERETDQPGGTSHNAKTFFNSRTQCIFLTPKISNEPT